ncbi:MAG: hypothetical protein ACFFCS_03115 [Candidatus Hodarchaeota archaeon]
MVECDKCGKTPVKYIVSMKEGTEIVKKNLCFDCYVKSQTDNMFDVETL